MLLMAVPLAVVNGTVIATAFEALLPYVPVAVIVVALAFVIVLPATCQVLVASALPNCAFNV